jgi:hypothetical protein
MSERRPHPGARFLILGRGAPRCGNAAVISETAPQDEGAVPQDKKARYQMGEPRRKLRNRVPISRRRSVILGRGSAR